MFYSRGDAADAAMNANSLNNNVRVSRPSTTTGSTPDDSATSTSCFLHVRQVGDREYSCITRHEKPGMRHHETVLAHDHIQTMTKHSCFDPRFHAVDLKTTEEIYEMNGMRSLNDVVFDGTSTVMHPCPLSKLHRTTTKGPLKIPVKLPIMLENNSQDHTGKKAGDYFRGTFNASTHEAINTSVNIGQAISQMSQLKNVDYIIPLGFTLRVLEFRGLPTMEVILACKPSIDLGDGKDEHKSLTNSVEWSTAQGVYFDEPDTRNYYNKEKASRRVHGIVCERSGYGAKEDTHQEIFTVEKTIAENSDFSRWMNILPSRFIEEARSTQILPVKDWKVAGTGGGAAPAHTIKAYYATVSDDPSSQLFTVWFWLTVREEAIKYMSEVLNFPEESLAPLRIGYEDPEDFALTGKKKLIIPIHLFRWYLGRIFYSHDLNQIVMPVSQGTSLTDPARTNLEVIFRPLDSTTIEPNSYHAGLHVRPHLLVELSVWFDLFDSHAHAKTGDTADNSEPNALTKEKKAYTLLTGFFKENRTKEDACTLKVEVMSKEVTNTTSRSSGSNRQ